MHRLSRSRGDHEPDKETKLSIRSVALLFPPKDVLERVRTCHSDPAAISNKPIESLYDLDASKTYPLSAHDHVRVIIAQDDTGVSIDRLLYDSKWTQKSRSDKDTNKKNEAGLFSLRPATSGSQSPTASGFHNPRPATSTRPERRLQSPPTTSAFVPSTQLRRAPVSVSLADTRNDPLIPIEGTAEEMDSWLDCMFGKAPMRYKGAVTKMHHLQRQPPDPLATPLQSTSQRNEFPFYPDRPTSLPRSKSKELIRLRKDALLISTTFAVNLHEEDLPEQLQQSNRRKRLSTPMFGVAILLPLAKPSNHSSTDESVPELPTDESDPVQSIIDNWHMYARALHALKATASMQIQQNLKAKAEAQVRARTARATAVLRQIKLAPRAFEHAATIIHASSDVMVRVTMGSRVLKVNPQGEWNIWRDELRDLAKIESDPKRGSLNPSRVNFIQSCLTAVLSVELGWLHIFAPPQHQTRLREERQQTQSALALAQNRIVVVTKDQNKARNLVFIFAKLFPHSQHSIPFARSRRSSQGGTAPSAKGVSAITQGLEAEKHVSDGSQPNGRFNGHPNGHPSGQDRCAPTIFETPSQTGSVMSPVKGPFNEPESIRKPSFTRGTGRIDIPGKATPALPLSATNSNRNTPSGSPEARPGSSASAHGDLMRHLQRSSSTTTSNGSTDTTGIWNSFRSSTWSLKPRRESSNTERSDSTDSQREQQLTSILKTSKSSVTRHGSSKLVRMVEDCTSKQDDRRKDSAQTRDPTPETMNGGPRKIAALHFNPPTHEVSDISYTYNQDEGVVDVDFPGCMASPNSTRSLTGRAIGCKVPSSNNRFPTFGTVRKTPERPPSSSDVLFESPAKYDRVAGYLEKFLPDFALQAVKPYSKMVDEIKRAMRAEPSPKIEPSGSLQIFSQEAWIDVCSTVIVDAEALVVKRLTLRRHVRYKLISPDESPSLSRHGGSIDLKEQAHPPHTNESTNTIKVTKSEEMESIRRTYKRNDHGQKVAFRDQRVQNSLSMNGIVGDNETYHSLPDQLKFFENGLSLSPDNLGSSASATAPNEQNKGLITEPSATHTGANDKRANSIAVGDDLYAFIDRKPGGSHKVASAGTATRRVTIKNKEGKITGWKEVQEGGSDEAGLNDLPTSFVEKRSDKTSPVIECQTLGESFDEEIISKPDSAVVNLLQQMVATSESRSRVHSRAGSIHSRAPSRSNSISSSGLTELQYESKKIIENSLEGLVSAVASDRYCSSSTPAGGLFGFGRNAPSSETSILRQSIFKWMHGDA